MKRKWEKAHALPVYHSASHRRAERDWERLVKEIPEDTRSVTARLFGDPLPGRSALEIEGAARAAGMALRFAERTLGQVGSLDQWKTLPRAFNAI